MAYAMILTEIKMNPNELQTQVISVDVESFLDEFGQKCVEFGYYYDQFMRKEINLGEITRHIGSATADAEGAFAELQAHMTPAQLERYKVIQITLDSMTASLIEAEIKRTKEVIDQVIRNGEYFLVNISYNSISASLYMVYNDDNPQHRAERDQRLAQVQREQDITQNLIKVLKAVEARIRAPHFNQIEYNKLQKAFAIYVEYFDHSTEIAAKAACDQRAMNLLKEHVDYVIEHHYFGDRDLAYRHVMACAKSLESLANGVQQQGLSKLVETVRPPDPSEKMRQLYHEALHCEGEANVYSAVVAFNNFAQLFPNDPQLSFYKQSLRETLQRKGYWE